jgi:pimeloyl-ACP methyl ester carboxylesterase
MCSKPVAAVVDWLLQKPFCEKLPTPQARPDGRLLRFAYPRMTRDVLPLQRGDPSTFDCMTTFALIHGAWHGAWCWEKVTPLLKQAGHDVVAPELPSEDGSAGFDAYADLVCHALRECDDDVVVVAHSLGGCTGAFVPALRPVRHLVYVCAAVPECGISLVDQQSAIATREFLKGWLKALSEPDEQLRTEWIDFDFVRRVFYADCDEVTVAAAIDHLRPQSGIPWTVPCSLTEHPSVRCTSVVCSEDRIVNPGWSRRKARELGADIVELPGSHSPLLSRPSAVADVLLHVAQRG